MFLIGYFNRIFNLYDMREKNVFLWNFSSLFFQIGLIGLNPMGGVGFGIDVYFIYLM